MAFCWIVCWSSVDKISCGQTVSCGFSQWIDGTTEWTSAPRMPGFWLRQGWPHHQYQGGVGTTTFSMITWPGDLIWSMFVLLICYIHSSLLITADLEYPPKKQFSTGWIHMFLGWVETTKQWWSLILERIHPLTPYRDLPHISYVVQGLGFRRQLRFLPGNSWVFRQHFPGQFRDSLLSGELLERRWSTFTVYLWSLLFIIIHMWGFHKIDPKIHGFHFFF